MLLKKSLFIISSAVMLAATTSAAIAGPTNHQVIAPTCLISAAKFSFKTLSNQQGVSLIEVNDAGIQQLAEAKHHTKPACGGFMDVSRAWESKQALRKQTPATFLAGHLSASKKSLTADKPTYQIKHEKQVTALIETITPANMWENLTTLTSFKDRYADSNNGVKAADWIKAKIESIAKETGHNDVTVYTVSTGSRYKQPSVVAKFGNSDKPGIVIGGHIDTLSSTWEDKPGADDDGSGSVTLMETARTILASGMQFEKPIYFIWYSAEEMGLVGSDHVVAYFQDKNIPVEAALQLDMTGYAYKNEPTMWLINDFVSKDLTKFMETLINTYVKQPVKYSKCGYACSDHASWNQAGIPAAFPFESEMGHDDPYIHTANDKMDVLSLSHMTDYAKLATSYAVEMAVPVSK